MKKLNLGSGGDYREDWINLDIRDNVKLDIKHDLGKFPYPFKPNTFDEVLINHVLEHVNEPIQVLKELTRICKNKAKIIINVPHAISYAHKSDIQHKSNFTENSFIEESLKQYNLENLKLIKKEFVFKHKWKELIPFKNYFKIFFNGLYDDLHFEFEVIK